MKRSIMALVGTVALAAVPVSSLAWAQATITPVGAVPFVTQQPANEWLARVFMGAKVQNTSGEAVGEVYDLVFSPQGQITTVVLGVGGFLGMGEHNVAVPYSALSFKVGAKNERIILVALTKDGLMKAPQFKAIEMTTLDKVESKASEIGHKAVDKAVELKDKAAAKIEDMKKAEPATK